MADRQSSIGSYRRQQRQGWHVALAAVLLAGLALTAPVPGSEAHTCTPDADIGVGGRLILPRGSGIAVVSLPSRETRIVPISPSQGVATGVAASADRSLLAVPRFWRPPSHQVGGQDILLIGPDGGTPMASFERARPGEALGAPAWLPDGSLVYDRRMLSGTAEVVHIERARPGAPGVTIAEDASAPAVSPDGALLAMVRFAGTDRLIVRPIDGGPEQVLVNRPELLSIAFPRFSPDGAWIAFTAAADPGTTPDEKPKPDARSAPNGGAATATAPALPVMGAWQKPLFGLTVPGSALSGPTRALYGVTTARAHGAPWDVWVVRPDGSDVRKVTSFADDDSSAAWSPDGRWLVTLSAEAVHVVAVSGTENYCISQEGGYGGIEWVP